MNGAKTRLQPYDELLTRFADAKEPTFRRQVAQALLFKGMALVQLAQHVVAIGVYQELVSGFKDDTKPGVRAVVATALSYQGATFSQLGMLDKAIAAYEELIARFKGETEPTLRELVDEARLYLRGKRKRSVDYATLSLIFRRGQVGRFAPVSGAL